MTIRSLILALLALGATGAAPPVEATTSESTTQVDRRLRACLSASVGDGHATVEAAVLAARAACMPQINKVRDARVLAATGGLEPEAALVIERRVTRELNNEIAHAVADLAGLSTTHAHHN